VICKHRDVSEACVIGVIDPEGGDRIPRAFVKLKSENGSAYGVATAEEIRQFANGNRTKLFLAEKSSHPFPLVLIYCFEFCILKLRHGNLPLPSYFTLPRL